MTLTLTLTLCLYSKYYIQKFPGRASRAHYSRIAYWESPLELSCLRTLLEGGNPMVSYAAAEHSASSPPLTPPLLWLKGRHLLSPPPSGGAWEVLWE